MPFIVAENPAGQLLGYAYVYPWKEKAAYRYTVENSIYLGPASTGKGLGKVLLGELIERSTRRRPQGDHRGHRRQGRGCLDRDAQELRLQGDRATWARSASSSTAGSAPCSCRSR